MVHISKRMHAQHPERKVFHSAAARWPGSCPNLAPYSCVSDTMFPRPSGCAGRRLERQQRRVCGGGGADVEAQGLPGRVGREK